MLHAMACTNLESKSELSVLNESMDERYAILDKALERSKELRNLMVATTSVREGIKSVECEPETSAEYSVQPSEGGGLGE